MIITEELITAVKGFEGLRLTAYRCPAGVMTIGYGHTGGVKPGTRISAKKAEELLRDDLARVSKGVLSLGVCRTDYELDALTDFAFNLGLGALKDSTLLKVIRAGDSPAHIEREFKRWVFAGGKIQEGRVKRRAWEARRYFGDV